MKNYDFDSKADNQKIDENKELRVPNDEISTEENQNVNTDEVLISENNSNDEHQSPTEARSDSKKSKKGTASLCLLMILPFLLFTIGVGMISIFFFREYVEPSVIWRFAVNANAVATPQANEDDELQSNGEVLGGSMAEHSIEPITKPNTSEDDSSDSSSEEGTEQIYYNKADFPAYKWGELWAKLSIPAIGLEEKNVYVGESNSIYKKGIGKRYGTRFPGQGGNIVLGAHVTREFYGLVDLNIGDKVYIETGYGSYVYEVYEKVIFSTTDYQYVMNYDDGEKLTLYTCHPREAAYRTERFGVLCKKISGPEWIELE